MGERRLQKPQKATQKPQKPHAEVPCRSCVGTLLWDLYSGTSNSNSIDHHRTQAVPMYTRAEILDPSCCSPMTKSRFERPQSEVILLYEATLQDLLHVGNDAVYQLIDERNQLLAER